MRVFQLSEIADRDEFCLRKLKISVGAPVFLFDNKSQSVQQCRVLGFVRGMSDVVVEMPDGSFSVARHKSIAFDVIH